MPHQDRWVDDLSTTPFLDNRPSQGETLDLAKPDPDPPSTRQPESPGQRTARELSREIRQLSHVRLLAAAGFFLVVLVLLMIRRLIFVDTTLWWFYATNVGLMTAAIVYLSRMTTISGRRLHGVELAVFGLMIVFLAVRQYDVTLAAAAHNPAVLPMAAKSTLMGSMLLMFAYAMLMPNTWQRAARMVLVIAVAPLVTEALIFATHRSVFQAARGVATKDTFSENVTFALISAGLSIFGTYRIRTLRVEAIEARELNQYQLGRKLGSGGMGEVFLAEHRFLKRPCAIKLIRPENATDRRSLARFEREVRATAKLTHPNTVEVFDYGRSDDGTFFYVMEYLPGMNLGEIVDHYGPMPPCRAIYLLRQACGALAEAHASGMIHRDLKPQNIFAATRGGEHDVAKILDFGLVKDTADQDSPALSREGTVRGTPHFMAPEQVVADPNLDHRCDLYAMGAVTYFLLTGQPPFDGDNPSRVMIAHARDPVRPPSEVNPIVPSDLERVILKCLAKAPSDRYPDAESLGDALDACASARDWNPKRAAQWWRQRQPK